MVVFKYILIVIYIAICLGLVFLVTKQSKGDSGASGTVMGAAASNFYEKNKGKTREGKMKKATIILAVAFAVLTLVLGIIYVV